VIRRLFWIIVGAVLGVTGYRRVTQLARSVTGGSRRSVASGRPRGRDLPRGRWAQSAALFARDVREGMDVYTDRHPRLAGHTLEDQQALAERRYQAGTGGEEPRRASRYVDHAKDGRW
jgi:hypothetical protein